MARESDGCHQHRRNLRLPTGIQMLRVGRGDVGSDVATRPKHHRRGYAVTEEDIMPNRSSRRVLAMLALVCTTLLGACDALDLSRDWSGSDQICTDRPGKPCTPSPN